MNAKRLLPLGAWALLMNVVGLFTWGYGPLTFACLTLTVALLFYLRAKNTSHPPTARAATNARPSRLLILLLAGALAYTAAGVADGFTRRPGWLIDIAENTYRACAAFTEGRNPYASRAQVYQRIEAGPNVEVEGEEVRMYGVAYRYGYPYFPGMFLSYLPAYFLVGGFQSIRAFNVVLLALNVCGVMWLASKLSGGRKDFGAPLVGAVAYLCVWVYPQEIFAFGIVDILVSTYALYAFVALAGGRPWAAGVLFGLAQGCKLLPGPLLLVPVVVALWGRREVWKVVAAYAMTAALVVLPFALWDAGAFLSATVLFYLTHHARGDDTSLWFFLPGALKGAFLAAGVVLSGASIFAFARPKRGALVDALTAAFVAYVVLMAFSKMTHLNYLWGVYPLGCVALAVLSGRQSQKSER